MASLDATCATWHSNGDRPAVVTLAGLVSRRRSPEVAAAARAWPLVADAWRLDRFGNPGVVALFTGEPGTGKTLAAVAIAAEIGLDLMEVDLSTRVQVARRDREEPGRGVQRGRSLQLRALLRRSRIDLRSAHDQVRRVPIHRHQFITAHETPG